MDTGRSRIKGDYLNIKEDADIGGDVDIDGGLSVDGYMNVEDYTGQEIRLNGTEDFHGDSISVVPAALYAPWMRADVLINPDGYYAGLTIDSDGDLRMIRGEWTKTDGVYDTYPDTTFNIMQLRRADNVVLFDQDMILQGDNTYNGYSTFNGEIAFEDGVDFKGGLWCSSAAQFDATADFTSNVTFDPSGGATFTNRMPTTCWAGQTFNDQCEFTDTITVNAPVFINDKLELSDDVEFKATGTFTNNMVSTHNAAATFNDPVIFYDTVRIDEPLTVNDTAYFGSTSTFVNSVTLGALGTFTSNKISVFNDTCTFNDVASFYDAAKFHYTPEFLTSVLFDTTGTFTNNKTSVYGGSNTFNSTTTFSGTNLFTTEATFNDKVTLYGSGSIYGDSAGDYLIIEDGDEDERLKFNWDTNIGEHTLRGVSNKYGDTATFNGHIGPYGTGGVITPGFITTQSGTPLTYAGIWTDYDNGYIKVGGGQLSATTGQEDPTAITENLSFTVSTYDWETKFQNTVNFDSTVLMPNLSTLDDAVVTVNGSGQLSKYTSSRRFKTDIKEVNLDTSKLMELIPNTFVFKTDEKKTVNTGYIAEDVPKEFCIFDEEGLPFAIKWFTIATYQNEMIKKMYNWMEIMAEKNDMREEFLQFFGSSTKRRPVHRAPKRRRFV